ncbi:MAG: hypothetical protein WEB60_10575, partial [Terrimicrobiaceae bacterium]
MKLLKKTCTSFVQAIDSDYFPEGPEAVMNKPEKMEIGRAVPFLILHLGCLGLIWVGWSPSALIVSFALYFIRIFSLNVLY